MTPTQAAQHVKNATDAHGLKIVLLPDDALTDITRVRQKVFELAQAFAPKTKFIHPNGEYVAAENLYLVAKLLAELLKHHSGVTDGG